MLVEIPDDFFVTDKNLESHYSQLIDSAIVALFHACVAMSVSQGVSITETLSELLSEASGVMAIDSDKAIVTEAYNRLIWASMGKREDEFVAQYPSHGLCGFDEVLVDGGLESCL